MKKIKFAQSMIMILLVFFLIYNSYFGWNEEPINETEALCDEICANGFKLAMIIYLLPIFSLYESIVKKNDKERREEELKEEQEKEVD